jgi:salicylate hydroxylase
VLARKSLYADGPSLKVFYEEDQSNIEEEFGAAFYFAHRVDLHDELKYLATREDGPGTPVKILTGTEVVGYVSIDPNVCIIFSEAGQRLMLLVS